MGGGSHRSDNALSVCQQHTAWGKGGGGSHRSDNALSAINSTQPGGGGEG